MRQADEIFAADDIDWMDVKCPEWKTSTNPRGEYQVWQMNEAERDEFDRFENEYREGKEKTEQMKGFRARLVCFTTRNNEKQLVFQPDDWETLLTKSSAVIARLAIAALQVNQMTDSATETRRKNSDQEGGDGSPSGLPPSSESTTSIKCSEPAVPDSSTNG